MPRTIELGVNTDYATFQDLCHSGGGADSGITITPATGIGDDACIITTPFGALGSFDLDFLEGCFGYFVSVAGPAGKPPPFPDATAQAYEKALALDACRTSEERRSPPRRRRGDRDLRTRSRS